MSRSERLSQSRALLNTIPARVFFEVPGKADVLYELRDYAQDPHRGAETARLEIPFLFKPFEVGQKPPPSKGQEPPFGREPTIHEYLDWTVTASSTLETLDFSGFRVLTLLPRYRPMWPPPTGEERPSASRGGYEQLGAPLEPIPLLMPYGRPISATTIRCGPDYIEVPFFATKPSARGRGYGKALLYAIEDICRFLGLSKILLCSTDDAVTIRTWQHLGFRHTMAHELAEWDIAPTELVHMTNTVQMVKCVGEAPEWKSFRIQHQGFDQRIYYRDSATLPPPHVSKKRKEERLEDASLHKTARVEGPCRETANLHATSSSAAGQGTLQNGRIETEIVGSTNAAETTPESDRNNIMETNNPNPLVDVG